MNKKTDMLKIQEEEADMSSTYTPIESMKTGTKKSKKIHHATRTLNIQNLGEMCSGAGFILSTQQIQHVTDYLFLLQKWNQSMNLVGKKFWQDVLSDLIMDSMHLAKYLEENPRIKKDALFDTDKPVISKKKYTFQSNTDVFPANPLLSIDAPSFEIWDLGAGAGIPGIPLRILWQLGVYTMIEVRQKRCFFLNTALASLRLPETFVFHGKAEDFMDKKKEKGIYADLILSRAFMPFEKMLPFVAPYLRKENKEENTQRGSIIFLTLEELHADRYNSDELQWETKQIYPYQTRGQDKFLCEVCLKN